MKHISFVDEFERRYVIPAPGPALVVGSRVYPKRPDRRRKYAHAIGIDMQPGDGVDLVMDLEEAIPEAKFRHVDCISVLEHSRRPWAIASNIERLLAPGGTLYLQVPFVWRVHGYPSDYWRFTVAAVRLLFPSIEWKRLAYVHYGETEEGEKLPKVDLEGQQHFPQTEVCGFGERAWTSS